MKTCKKCGVEKPISEYYRSRTSCRVCVRAASSARYWRKRDEIRAQYTKWRNSIPGYNRNANLKSNYGITLEEFEDMAQLQNNRCAICRRDAKDAPKGKLFVDHCHHSGKFRGLICQHCNSMLGHAKDRIATLLEAASYLKMRGAA